MKPEVLSTIYRETVAKRKLPVNFNPDHLPLFAGELERVIPESRLLRFRDVLASPFVVRDRARDLLLVLPGKYETRDVVKSSLKAFGVVNTDFIGSDEVVE